MSFGKELVQFSVLQDASIVLLHRRFGFCIELLSQAAIKFLVETECSGAVVERHTRFHGCKCCAFMPWLKCQCFLTRLKCRLSISCLLTMNGSVYQCSNS